MDRMMQPLVKIVTRLQAAGVLSELNNLRLDPGYEGRSTGRVIEGIVVTNVDEICPCSRQDNKLCHDQGLST